MTEKHIILEDIDPVMFYGINNINLQLIRSLYPKLRIVARDNVMRIYGEEENILNFEKHVNALKTHINKFNSITEEEIIAIIKGDKTNRAEPAGVIVYNISGKPIRAHNSNQELLVKAFAENDMVFAVGPAGTGKTYLSIALAVKALKEKSVKKILLCRPAVEAGEKLGFLPGDMKDKIDPYLQPLYDALEDMVPVSKLADMTEKRIVQIAPLAFMRGRTLNDAAIILDEAQNTTPAQIKMFLTRLGRNSKMIITGDLTQIDLPKGQTSGLKDAIETLGGIEGLEIIKMQEKDIVRHHLVTRIVKAYNKKDHQERSGITSKQDKENL